MSSKRPIEVLTLSSDDEDDHHDGLDDSFDTAMAQAIELSKQEAVKASSKQKDAGE